MRRLIAWFKRPKKILSFLDEHGLKIGIGFILAFIPLYPKFPLINIHHTWVYVRAEDFLVAVVIILWFLQLIKKKVGFKTPLTIPIFAYWFVGGVSLLFSIIFLRSQLANFFPNVAVLHYLRRFEYALPFFIAFSTVKSLKDVKYYLVIIFLTLLGVVFYGFGQRYLGFPAYLTMNEEFAKGLALYLPPTGRVTSTFAGHYDLAAFLVMMIVFFASLIFGVRKMLVKVAIFLLIFASFVLLLFTASRISFGVYILSISFMLYLQKKKWLILPVVSVSLFILTYTSGASERFAKTFRVERVVYNTKTGKPIAVLQQPLKIKSQIGPVVTPPPEDNLPLGSGFLEVPILEKSPQATTVATIRRPVIASLKTASSASEIATISGDFLIRRTIVYDISFTTRFQGEWPRAWEAFKRNPMLGSGYSSISLATDGDYLRALGETGILGFLTLLSIFFTAILIIRRALKRANLPFERSIIIGVGAVLTSFLLTAFLIDVFEASKVAFTFWMLLGIVFGMISLKGRRENSLFQEAVEVLRLPATSIFIFLLIGGYIFYHSLGNYFTGDDFIWLRLAADSSKGDIIKFFLWNNSPFYQPLIKSYFTLIRPLFDLKPFGYHLADYLMHFGSVIAVYFISLSLTKRKLIAFLTGLFFLLQPIHGESVFWISSTSGLFAAFFYLWSYLCYLWWWAIKVWWRPLLYILSILSFSLGIFSHEVALTLPLILFAGDLVLIHKPRKLIWRLVPLAPYFMIIDAYLWLRVGAGTQSLNFHFQNFIFNFFGNLWGYLGIFIAGNKFIPLYDNFRFFFSTHQLWMSGFILLFLLAISIFLARRKQLLRMWLQKEHLRIYLFAGIWFVVTLLPFVGLGDISERYAYLASFAFILSLVILIISVFEQFVKVNRFLALCFASALISGIFSALGLGMTKTQSDWQKAGETANRILLTISSNYASFPEKTTLYFVNLPVRRDRAWIYPSGLEDGLWFIYKDKMLKVQNAKNVEEAMEAADKNQPAHAFIFENGELKEIKTEEQQVQ